MENRKYWIGILLVVITIIGCINNQSLNGTWYHAESDSINLKLNNGNFESTHKGEPMHKGTYTVNNGKVIMETTSAYGSYLNLDFGISYFDSRWYTTDELRNIFDDDSSVNKMIFVHNAEYNTLTRTNDNGETIETYIKTDLPKGIRSIIKNSNRKPGTTGKSSDLIGKWVPESGQRISSSSDLIEKRMELFKDGTGIGDGFSFTWKTENHRLILKFDMGMGVAYEYKISGATLILTNDDGVSAVYKKE